MRSIGSGEVGGGEGVLNATDANAESLTACETVDRRIIRDQESPPSIRTRLIRTPEVDVGGTIVVITISVTVARSRSKNDNLIYFCL